MVRALVVVALAFALAPAAGCGGDEAPLLTGDAALRAAIPRLPTEAGRFAQMTKVGDRRWSIPFDTAAPAPDDGTGAKGGGSGGGGGSGSGGNKKFGPTTLYLDGLPLAVVAWYELPPWLETTWIEVGDGADTRKVSRFKLAAYLGALGVDLRKVRGVQFFGGRGRVATTTGDELRRIKGDLTFSFTAGDVGKMRMHWRGDFAVSDNIDKVQAVQVYVDQPVPAWDRSRWALVDPAGQPIEGIPYATTDLKGGLRIYVDGRIAHVLKRGAVLGGGEQPHEMDGKIPRFRLLDYLDAHGVATRKLVAMEVVAGDGIAARLEGAAMRPKDAPLMLSIPPKDEGADRGKVVLHVGAESHDATALLLYSGKRARALNRRTGGTP